MPIFKYRAKTPENKLVDGLVEAEAETIAFELLKERNYQIISLDLKRHAFLEKITSWQTVSKKDLVVFTRQLSVMVEADIPLVIGLKSIYEQTENKRLRVILSDVAGRVEGGMRLSEALGCHARVFDNFFINLIRTGESSGQLSEVLNYLADQLEKDYDLNKKLIGALIYPAFIIGAIVILGIVLMIFVVPKLTEMLFQSGATLPWSTKMLIAISNFLIYYGWILVLILIGLILAFYLLRKAAVIRFVTGNVKLRAPIFGSLLKNTYMIRFSRSLNTLVAGGVPLVEGLEISTGIVDNAVYEKIFTKVKKEVEDGTALAVALRKHEEIPKLVSQLIETGEETGHLEQILEKISDFYTHEVENSIGKLMSLLEPIIMVVLGVGVAFVIMSVIMPMYELATQL